MNGRLSPARTFAPRCTWRSPTSDDRPRPLDSGFPKWRQATWRRHTATDAAGLETEVLRLVAHPGWKFARLSAGGRWIRTVSTAARKAGNFWSIPGTVGVSNPVGAPWQSLVEPDEMRPAGWNGAASQGSDVVLSRCFSASRCASSSFLSANLAPQYWHQNGCHRHSGRFGGGSCALSTRLINLVLRI